MPSQKPLPNRQSIRLPDYDYRQGGAYFITILAYQRECIFGDIAGEAMQLSAIGDIVRQCWHSIPDHHPNARCDAFVVMPNHLHGILFLVDDPARSENEEDRPAFGKSIAGSLSTIVGSFKSAATKLINRQRETPGGKVWHRGFYERIIRDEKQLQATREYILTNPVRWAEDRENPQRIER